MYTHIYHQLVLFYYNLELFSQVALIKNPSWIFVSEKQIIWYMGGCLLTHLFIIQYQDHDTDIKYFFFKYCI